MFMLSDELAGIEKLAKIHRNLSPPELVEASIRRDEGFLAGNGALVAVTGKRTGRSPKDRFFVSHGASRDQIAWGATNQAVEPDVFDALFDKVRGHLEGR
ncbi:MAG: phosphoenolpyruvate carboxykinase (ATP), partial [Actinobacteria bacterium]|nr:phosphoenolpyruvate carboxykinase (ATP) [Actinomycetota bacterium]